MASRSIVIFVLLLSTPSWQAATNPPPELGRLAWMVGEWDTKAIYRLLPEAESFEGHSTERVRLSNNQHFLVSEQDGLMPDGWHAKLIVTGWEATRHRYKMVDIDLSGEVTELSLVINEEVMDILYYLRHDGRYIRIEEKVTHLSPTKYKSQASCTDEGKTWICYDAVSQKRSSDKTK